MSRMDSLQSIPVYHEYLEFHELEYLSVYRPLDRLPESVRTSIFLAGPTPRTPSWRTDALRILDNLGYKGAVFFPEPASGQEYLSYVKQVKWEERFLNAADCIVFWMPREAAVLPARTTNTQWGKWGPSGKAVFGAHPAAAVRYQRLLAQKWGVPCCTTLEDTLWAALQMVG
eukprot:RCo022193